MGVGRAARGRAERKHFAGARYRQVITDRIGRVGVTGLGNALVVVHVRGRAIRNDVTVQSFCI
jgi:hypothetical protein